MSTHAATAPRKPAPASAPIFRRRQSRSRVVRAVARHILLILILLLVL
jgi:hypothetical protein